MGMVFPRLDCNFVLDEIYHKAILKPRETHVLKHYIISVQFSAPQSAGPGSAAASLNPTNLEKIAVDLYQGNDHYALKTCFLEFEGCFSPFETQFKLLSDIPYVVKFLSYLIFEIYAVVAFYAYCCIRGLHISWFVKLTNMLFKH